MGRFTRGARRRAASAAVLAGAAAWATLPVGLAAAAPAAAHGDGSSTAAQVQMLRSAAYADGLGYTESDPTMTKSYTVVLRHGTATGQYGDRFTLVGRPAVSSNVYGAPGALVVLRDKRPKGASPAYLYQLWLFRVVGGQVHWVADGVALDRHTDALNEHAAQRVQPVVLGNHRGGFRWQLRAAHRRHPATYLTAFSLQQDGNGGSYLLDSGSRVARR